MVSINPTSSYLYFPRNRNSIAFTPAESQEDMTVVSQHSDTSGEEEDNNGEEGEDCMMTRESMMVLKEKLVEMERGMEFLSLKGQDYEELQMLAEEEAETICQLEKENYKLTTALNNIESR